ncbi:PhzF family phenazine biosynthesis protein [Streptomyces sp. NPDC059740]|uniref:PhzF family phenazine biosynthesis protein n=1 Tax=Streptomyces sp. NPDC059740 TaxID=3346926 RepID=UPI0036598E5E
MRIRIVDAFTDRPFAGNPAGVVLLEDGEFPPDDLLQDVAAEVNLSETAFAHRLPEGSEAHWALRWLTPATEVDLCGHATLATAHVLHTTGLATGPVRFRTRSGILTTTTEPDGGLTLDFPTAPLTEVPVPEWLAPCLAGDGRTVELLGAYDTGPLGDLLVELPDEESVRQLAPDHRALAARFEARGVIVTAAAGAGVRTHDFTSRFFGPGVGIDEDPVTGSAHTALAPFWSARLGRETLTGHQGGRRRGYVRTRLRGDRTLLTGHAVTVLDGELLAP